MTVLNQASDGQVNTLITLVRASVRFGPRSRADLLALCGADLSAVDKTKLNGSFLTWTDLGLFETVGDLTALSEPYRTRLSNDVGKAEARLPSVAREIVLLPENNARFWEQKNSKSADLSRGLSWMLAQDVYSLDTSSHEAIEALEAVQVKDLTKRMLQNDKRIIHVCDRSDDSDGRIRAGMLGALRFVCRAPCRISAHDLTFVRRLFDPMQVPSPVLGRRQPEGPPVLPQEDGFRSFERSPFAIGS